MSMKEIRKLTALQLAEKIKKKEVGVEEAAKATLSKSIKWKQRYTVM